LRLYNSASRPPSSPPLKSSSCLSFSADRERGEGVEEGAKSYDREKAWLSVNHSVLAEEEAPLTRGGERRLLKSSFICVVADGRWSEEGIFEWEFNCAMCMCESVLNSYKTIQLFKLEVRRLFLCPCCLHFISACLHICCKNIFLLRSYTCKGLAIFLVWTPLSVKLAFSSKES
jgi:hypothetical protein